MKTLRLSFAVPAVLMLLLWAGCKDYDLEDGTDLIRSAADRSVYDCFGADGTAWLSLLVETPAAATTRAANVDSEAGTTDEQRIENATLLLMSGATEDVATVQGTYNLMTSMADDNDDLPTQVERRLKVNRGGMTRGDQLFALVIVNAPDDLTPDDLVGLTLGQLQATTVADCTTPPFLMTNAPVASTAGGQTTNAPTAATTLVGLTSANFSSDEDGTGATSAEIVVERAVARISVSDVISYSDDLATITGNTALQFTAADLAYALDAYTTETRLLRRFLPDWLSIFSSQKDGYYRFVDGEPIVTGSYRTYWAEGPHYADGSADGLSYCTAADFKSATDFNPQYVGERTTDVAHMTMDLTTALVVRLQLNGGQHFYTISTDGDNVYTDPDNPRQEEGTSANESFARADAPARRSAARRSPAVDAASIPTIDKRLRTWLMTNTDVKAWIDTYAAGNASALRIEMGTRDAATGAIGVTVSQTVCVSGTPGATAFDALVRTLNGKADDEDPGNLGDYIAANMTIYKYVDGYCYYRLPIRHFGNDETPLGSGTGTTPSTLYGTGEDAANDYLGRYGVVRNNAYTVRISSVAHIGSPVLPQKSAVSGVADDCPTPGAMTTASDPAPARVTVSRFW